MITQSVLETWGDAVGRVAKRARLLVPDCDLKTVQDGRGAIVSFCPDEPVAEAVLNIINKGKVRGYHYHPEFEETVVMVSGMAVEVVKYESGEEETFHLSDGMSLQIPAGVYHTLYAITDCRAVMLLSKRWKDCSKPIVKEKPAMTERDETQP